MHVMEIGLWSETALTVDAEFSTLPNNVDETDFYVAEPAVRLE